MKQYAFALLGALLLFSLTGCTIPTRPTYYIYTVKKYCPNGLTLMTDNTCRELKAVNQSFYQDIHISYPITRKKPVKRAKKTIKKQVNCEQVLREINQCTK